MAVTPAPMSTTAIHTTTVTVEWRGGTPSSELMTSEGPSTNTPLTAATDQRAAWNDCPG